MKFSVPSRAAHLDAPAGLLCDLLAHPGLGRIATLEPTFGWCPGGASPQTAWQIRVASSEALLASPDLWDSGRVDSAESLHILYAGEPLAWMCTYWWQVRVWREGAASPWSEPQSFTPSAGEEPISAYDLQVREIAPAAVEPCGEKSWLIDFGRHAFGWVEIEVEAVPVGTRFVAHLGETLRGGRIDRQPEGAIRYAACPLTVEPDRVFYRPLLPGGPLNMRDCAIRLPAKFGMVMPFRYVEIEGLAESPVVRMYRLQYPFDESAAAFRSCDPALDAVWEMCRYSILATSFAGYYVDGDRERIPYEADVYINQLSHYAVDREYSLARRSHEYVLENSTWPTEWKQQSILIAWADYEATGDTRSLVRCYERLRDEKLLLQFARADGLLDTRNLRDIVDWPICERDGFDFRPVNAVVNAFHYQTLLCMARIARAIGRAEAEALDFEWRATEVFTTFNDICWNEESGLYIDGEGSDHSSVHANLFALAFDLIPPGRLERVVEWIKSRGMACSVYPAQFLLEGLFKAGEATHAIDLMRGRGLRSWQNMLDHGATITWEAWDQSIKPNQDWNHAWATAPANIITRYVLGVRPLEPGYGRIEINPQLGPLTVVHGTVPTIRGPVKITAIQKNKTLPPEITVQVPMGIKVVSGKKWEGREFQTS